MAKNIALLESKSGAFVKIVEVKRPIRFYWSEDGFDGIEIGPFRPGLTQEENVLLNEVLAVFEERGKK